MRRLVFVWLSGVAKRPSDFVQHEAFFAPKAFVLYRRMLVPKVSQTVACLVGYFAWVLTFRMKAERFQGIGTVAFFPGL